MKKETAEFETVAGQEGYKTAAEFRRIVDLGKRADAANREVTGRKSTAPPPEPSRPVAAAAAVPPASALAWPSEKWKGSPEKLSRKRHQIVAFLRRVWVPFIEENKVIVTREILKEHDKEAAAAVKGYLHYNKLPPDIRIFTSDQLKEHLAKRPVATESLPALVA